MNIAEFRKELVKIMPGYNWTVHKSTNPMSLSATGIKSSGFNRLSTLVVYRREDANKFERYKVMSAGFGTRAPWAHTTSDRTLARALRDLQNHYEMKANTYRGLASQLQTGRVASSQEGLS